MAHTRIDYLCQFFAPVWTLQTIGTSFNLYFVRLCAAHQASTLLPPEVITAFNITRNEKDSDRNLQLTGESKTIRVVIAISIVKRQHKGRALILFLVSFV